MFFSKQKTFHSGVLVIFLMKWYFNESSGLQLKVVYAHCLHVFLEWGKEL
jgi:hypothetical protein